MKLTIRFRRATIEDRGFLLDLRKASMADHLENAGLQLSEQQHYERIDEFYNDSYIICHDKLAIGLIKLGQFPDKLHIRQFQIMPEYHRKGIGSNVLTIVKRKALNQSLAITLNVLFDNPACQLYLRHGFEVEGKNSLEYQMRWRPSIEQK